MNKLIIFSGAGLSAESGLQTFRSSPDGLWYKYDINQVCNYQTWKTNFHLVHEFYNMRRAQLATVEPNSAHRLIAEWQKRYNTIVVTQNVDDLLERAGCTDVIHLHGYLPEMTCEVCGNIWNIGYASWDFNRRCPRIRNERACNSIKGVKPNVVFFGQEAPRYRDLSRIVNELQQDDIILVTGTSEEVIPFGSQLHRRPGFKVFNALERSISPSYDQSLIMPATQAFGIIDQILPLFEQSSHQMRSAIWKEFIEALA